MFGFGVVITRIIDLVKGIDKNRHERKKLRLEKQVKSEETNTAFKQQNIEESAKLDTIAMINQGKSWYDEFISSTIIGLLVWLAIEPVKASLFIENLEKLPIFIQVLIVMVFVNYLGYRQILNKCLGIGALSKLLGGNGVTNNIKNTNGNK